MSFFTNVEAWWATTEADVLALIANVKADVVIAEEDAQKALDWINSHVGQINASISEINGALQTIVKSGVVTIPPAVGVAIEDANKAVAALNDYRVTVAAGGSTTDAVVNGYAAIKQAQSASAIATLAIVTAPSLAASAS